MPEATGDIPRPRPPRDVLSSVEARYEALLAGLPDTALLLLDRDLRLLAASGRTDRWLGLDPATLTGETLAGETLPGKTLQDVVPPEQAAFLQDHHRAALSGECRTVDDVGRVDPAVVWEVAFRPVHDAAGQVVATMAVARDVTATRAAEHQARTSRELLQTVVDTSEQRFSAAFDHAPVGMALARLDPDGRGALLRVNDTVCELVGRSRSELLASDPWLLVDAGERARFAVALRDLAAGTVSRAVTYHEHVRPDGRHVWLRVGMAAATDPSGAGMLLIGHVEDITQQRELVADLRHRAFHDQLTGLPNRYLLDEQLRHALDRLARRDTSVAALYVDVDDFKHVNDEQGHQVGDAVLMTVAEKVRGVLRASDTAARLGGDEFVVLCEDLSDEAEAGLVGRRILEAVRDPSGWTTACRPTVSVGLATTHDAATHADALLRDADRALQRAKQRGKNRLVVFAPEMRGPTR